MRTLLPTVEYKNLSPNDEKSMQNKSGSSPKPNHFFLGMFIPSMKFRQNSSYF